MNTLRDLVRKLKKYDEETIIDLLDITGEDIVNRFEDKVEERFEEIEAFLEGEGDHNGFDNDEELDEWN
jgi:hypothetical protein